MTTLNKVFIADIATVIPQQYLPDTVIKAFYPEELVSKRGRALAYRLADQIGVNSRSVVIDLKALPDIKLLSEQYLPLSWGGQIVDKFSEKVDLNEIGYLSASYNNVISQANFLPNLACQIALDKGLCLRAPAENLAFYGCASGILSLKSAVKYCRQNNKAAVVFMYEHCTMMSNPVFDVKDKNFKESLRSHLLFNDGAAGLLVLPETMVENNNQYMEIIDVKTGWCLGEAIGMRHGRFLVGGGVADVMPALVTRESILPLLRKHTLAAVDVDEWSIHQGGIAVLKKFMDKTTLGLSEKQISHSLYAFNKYGNLSSPSCFFVLKDFFDEEVDREQYGIITSFGAGYYYGSVLYKRHVQ